MADDLEYSLDHDPIYHAMWQRANPQLRGSLNRSAEFIRDLYQHGWTPNQILQHMINLMNQANVPVNANDLRDLIRVVIFKPHIPVLRHPPNKRIPDSDDEELEEEMSKLKTN